MYQLHLRQFPQLLAQSQRVTLGRFTGRNKEHGIGHNAAPRASAALWRCVKGWIMCRIKALLRWFYCLKNVQVGIRVA